MHPYGSIGISRENIHRIALYTEITPCKIPRSAAVQAVHQPMQENGTRDIVAYCEIDHAFLEFLGISYTVKTRDGSHDDNIPSRRQEGRYG